MLTSLNDITSYMKLGGCQQDWVNSVELIVAYLDVLFILRPVQSLTQPKTGGWFVVYEGLKS